MCSRNSYQGNHSAWVIFVWLLLFSFTLVIFRQVAVCGNSSFFLLYSICCFLQNAVVCLLRSIYPPSYGQEFGLCPNVAFGKKPGAMRTHALISLRKHLAGGLLGQPTGVGVDFVGDTATGCRIPEVILFQSNVYYLAPKCVFTKSIFVTWNGRSHYSWSSFAFLSVIVFLTNFRKALGTACPLRGEGKKTQLTHPSFAAFDQPMLSASLHPHLFSYL